MDLLYECWSVHMCVFQRKQIKGIHVYIKKKKQLDLLRQSEAGMHGVCAVISVVAGVHPFQLFSRSDESDVNDRCLCLFVCFTRRIFSLHVSV